MATQILLNPIGSAGDVFPFLALGRELQKRGHHVAVMTNPLFIENVGQAGMEFIAVGSTESLRAVGTDPRLHHPGNAWKLALKWGAAGTMKQSFEIIRERRKKCDTMLVAPFLGLGARTAAEAFRLPLATIVLSPFVIRSLYQSPVIKPMVLSDWVPKISKRFQFWFADRFVIDPILKADVNVLRRENGLAPQSRYLHRWCFSDDLTLALFPKIFAPPQPDWPANTHVTGHICWDPPIDSQVATSLDEFVKPEEKKPIVVLAGSAGPESTGFYESWIQVTQRLGRNMILLERNHNKVPDKLPPHVLHARYIPIDIALKQSALIAHSGGVGATLRSLEAGVPQILFPRVNDQPDNANRVRNLGIGKVIAKNTTVEQIVTAIKEVLDDDSIVSNCQSGQAALQALDPVQTSCDLIESTFARYRK